MNNNKINLHNKSTAFRFLINSIAHFSDIKNIDKRSYLLTSKLDQYSNLKKTIKLTALKLNETVDYVHCSRPVVIISDDVEGSRVNNPNLTNPVYPHQHSLIIQSVESLSNDEQSNYTEVIRGAVSSINEIEQRTNCNLDIRKYDNDKSLLHVISYTLKTAISNYDGKYDFGVYPYEIDIHHRSKSVRDGAKQNAEKLYHDVLNDPAIAFSQGYLEKHGGELDDIRALEWANSRRTAKKQLDSIPVYDRGALCS